MPGVRGQVRASLVNKLTKLRGTELADFSASLAPELLPRLLLYMSPDEVGAALLSLRSRDEAKFNRVSRTLIKVPEATRSAARDPEIEKLVDEFVARTSTDTHKPFLPWYKTLLESVDDTTQDLLVETFGKANPTVDGWIRDNVITFGTFFRLHGDVQEEILDGLLNKDIAALVTGLDDVWRAQILRLVGERRAELVTDEITQLQGRGARAVEQSHASARRLIVQMIRKVKGTGSIRDLLATAQDALPSAASATSTPSTPGTRGDAA